MVSSLDGFISKKDGSIHWMESTDTYEKGKELTEEEIEGFLSSIDCYIAGARTYETALKLGWPYGEVPFYVFTHRDLPCDRPNVHFLSGDILTLVNERVKPHYKNIWLVGGSMLAKEFLRLDLVDEIVVSIVPIILGEGLLFFDFIGKEYRLQLKEHVAYKNGTVELTYLRSNRESS